MNTSTKKTENLAECGNKSKPLLAEVLISYIENDAEIAIPINELMNEDGTHFTKKEYGKVLLKYLCIELREYFC
jgi:lysophospholipase L1-like esterase